MDVKNIFRTSYFIPGVSLLYRCEVTMDVPLLSVSQSAWNKVISHVEDAVVFIDSKAGECLHWSIGLNSLLTGGALAIKELNAYTACISRQI